MDGWLLALCFSLTVGTFALAFGLGLCLCLWLDLSGNFGLFLCLSNSLVMSFHCIKYNLKLLWIMWRRPFRLRISDVLGHEVVDELDFVRLHDVLLKLGAVLFPHSCVAKNIVAWDTRADLARGVGCALCRRLAHVLLASANAIHG